MDTHADLAPAVSSPTIAFEGSPEAQAKFVAELALAKLEFGDVLRDRTGQYGNQRFQYATLGSLTAATEGALASHGIVVINSFTSHPTDNNKQRLNTWVMGHGARIVACLDFIPREVREEGERKGEFIKELGKLQTYLVRYQYRALFTLDSEPDADDAPADAPADAQRRSEPRREAPRPEPRTEAAPVSRAPQNAPQAQQAPAATVPQNTAASAKPAPHDPPPPAVTPVTPKTEGPDDGDDEAPEHATLLAITKLLEDTGKGKMLWNKWCVDAVGVPLAVMKQSRQRAQTFLEHLQTMALQTPATQPAAAAGAPS